MGNPRQPAVESGRSAFGDSRRLTLGNRRLATAGPTDWPLGNSRDHTSSALRQPALHSGQPATTHASLWALCDNLRFTWAFCDNLRLTLGALRQLAFHFGRSATICGSLWAFCDSLWFSLGVLRRKQARNGHFSSQDAQDRPETVAHHPRCTRICRRSPKVRANLSQVAQGAIQLVADRPR